MFVHKNVGAQSLTFKKNMKESSGRRDDCVKKKKTKQTNKHKSVLSNQIQVRLVGYATEQLSINTSPMFSNN